MVDFMNFFWEFLGVIVRE